MCNGLAFLPRNEAWEDATPDTAHIGGKKLLAPGDQRDLRKFYLTRMM
jgi:hypothetical protein